MKKIGRQFLLIVLCLAMLQIPAVAASDNRIEDSTEIIDLLYGQKELYTQDELMKIAEAFSNWTDEELNGYISYLEEASKKEEVTRASVPTGSGQAAWLAAASIVEDKYPCVAALIRASAFGRDYVESLSPSQGDSIGLFQKKIKTTAEYRSYVNQLKSQTAKDGQLMTFEANENADLAYSLHSCTAYYSKTGLGNLTTYTWYIYDIFDFKWDEEYNSPFISLVNNAAYLSQQVGALNKINVYIHFNPVGGI